MVNLKSFENLKKLPKNSNIIIYPNSLLGIGLRRMLLKKRPDLKFICFFDDYKKKNLKKKIIPPNFLYNQHKYKILLPERQFDKKIFSRLYKFKKAKIYKSYVDDFNRTFKYTNPKKKHKIFYSNNLKRFHSRSSKILYKLICNSIFKQNNKKLINFFLKKNDGLFSTEKTKQYTDFIKIRKNYNIFDVGAYKGEATKKFLRQSKKAKVICVDIQKTKEIIQLTNKYKNVKFFKCGLSNKNYKSFFSKKGSESHLSKKKLNNNSNLVSIFKFGHFLKKINFNEKIDLIKIDIEGEELNALKGAIKIIKKHRPFLIIACYHGANQFFQIPNFLMHKLRFYKYELQTYRSDGIDTVVYCLPNEKLV